MGSYHIKHEPDKPGLEPWELWYKDRYVAGYVTREEVNAQCDFCNYFEQRVNDLKSGKPLKKR